MKHMAIIMCLFYGPAHAGVKDVVEQDIIPGFAAFAHSTSEFADVANATCDRAALATAYPAVMTAWMQVQHWHIGPSQDLYHEVAFWPDSRGFIPSTLSSLIADKDPVIEDTTSFAEVSIAGRGLFALEMLIFDERFLTDQVTSYECQLVQAIATDLSNTAETLRTGWAEYSTILLTARATDNPEFRSIKEAESALYTQILTSLEFTADQRIDRPLGTLEHPRPTRAEAWRSSMSLSNIQTATQAAVSSAKRLYDGATPELDAAIQTFQDASDRTNDPIFAEIDTDLSAWLRLQILGERVSNIHTMIEQELGAAMGLSAGFNAGDGD